MQYYYSLDGNQRQGPVSLEQLRAAGVGPETTVWREGMADWSAAKDVPELSGLFAPPMTTGAPPVRVQYQTPTSQQGTNGLAITSMVVGIVGLVLTPCISFLAIAPAILAIIFGHVSRGQIRRGQGTGAGSALAGLILGYVTTGLLLLFVVFFVFLSFLSPRSTIFAPATPSQPSVPATVPVMPKFPQPKPFPTTFPSR